jgi:hypothetical protein
MSISAKRKPSAQREQTTESGTVLDFPLPTTRTYLTPEEIERLMSAARAWGRYGRGRS